MAQIQNLDTGIRNALVAYLRERGELEKVAGEKADANLAAAKSYFESRVASFEPTGKALAAIAKRSSTPAVMAAFKDLKDWSRTNIA